MQYSEEFQYHPKYYRSDNVSDKFEIGLALPPEEDMAAVEFFFPHKGERRGFALDMTEATRLAKAILEYRMIVDGQK